MTKDWIIFIPIFTSFFLSVLPYSVKNTDFRKCWFHPPSYIFAIMWVFSYLLLGTILWKCYDNPNKTLFWTTLFLTFLNLIWQIVFTRLQNYRLAIWIVMLMIPLSFFIFSEMFYNTSMESNRLYVNFFSVYIGWLIICYVLSSQSMDKTLYKLSKLNF